MCNLYSHTRAVDAMRQLFAPDLLDAGGRNLEPQPAIYPDQTAPVVVRAGDGLRLDMARWGLPTPQTYLAGKRTDRGVTNVRNPRSPHCRAWLGPANRCLVPFDRFAEPVPVGNAWFTMADARPAFFAGIVVRGWTSVRKLAEGPVTPNLFAFLATEANAVVGADLRQQADLQCLITRFGEDSLQVARARREADRAVYEALALQRDVSADLRAELMAAWDAVNKIGGINLAQHLGLAFDVAQLLSADLVAAWNAATGIAGTNIAGPISAAAGAGRGAGPGGPDLDPHGFRGQITAQMNWKPPKVGAAGGSGGGGGAAARDEADGVEELIARLRGEIEIKREADPVQRELLELREELAGATASQRAEVEELIRTGLREAETMEMLTYVRKQAGDALIDALMGGRDAGEQLIRTLSRAVLQAALLGEGPLAALFGGRGIFGATPGGGGILGAILGTVLRPSRALADGAAAQVINGDGPRFAKAAATGPAGAAGGPGGTTSTIKIDLGPGLEAAILERARGQSIEIAQAGIEAYDRDALPLRVKQVSGDPRRRG
ncbi:MAG: hypothetical protein ACT4OK_01140 [Gemmobacter sp.]